LSTLVVYGVSAGLVHVKTIAIFITHVHCAQGRNEVRCAWGKKQVWRPHVRTWGLSEANVLCWRKYWWDCWDFWRPPSELAPHSDSAPGKLCAPHVTPLTVQYLVETLLSNLCRVQHQ